MRYLVALLACAGIVVSVLALRVRNPPPGYADTFTDYLAFLRPRLVEAHRVLTPTGSLFFHIDPREVHYCKVLLDEIFGRPCFQNEIIWAYDYGARAKRRWPAKHDNILWYTRSPEIFTFNLDRSDRIPYMAPNLVGQEKALRGKTPTDVWWHTIVSPTGKEKTGYPTQKPLGILERIVKVHSDPATSSSTSSPAPAPPASPPPATAAASSSSTPTPKPSPSCTAAYPLGSTPPHPQPPPNTHPTKTP